MTGSCVKGRKNLSQYIECDTKAEKHKTKANPTVMCINTHTSGKEKGQSLTECSSNWEEHNTPG